MYVHEVKLCADGAMSVCDWDGTGTALSNIPCDDYHDCRPYTDEGFDESKTECTCADGTSNFGRSHGTWCVDKERDDYSLFPLLFKYLLLVIIKVTVIYIFTFEDS